MHDEKIADQLEPIFPEVIGAVISFDQDNDRVNMCPVNFQTVSTKYEKPVTVCIGLSNTSQTLKNLQDTKQFVYAYPSSAQLKDTIYCGTVSGAKTDKLKDIQLQFTKSKTVRPPNLQSAVINFECRVVHSYAAGDFTLIVGEVLHISDGETALQKIYSLGGMKYGTISTDLVLQEGREFKNPARH